MSKPHIWRPSAGLVCLQLHKVCLCNYYIILACHVHVPHHTHYRYYTSVPLTDILLEKGTVFTGTAMKNRRDLPSPIRDVRFSMTAGETRCFRDGRLMALAWRAESKKKPLIMLSSSCSAKPVTVLTRRERVSKPSVVNTYNCSMNGVDIADQLTPCQEDTEVVAKVVFIYVGGIDRQQLSTV